MDASSRKLQADPSLSGSAPASLSEETRQFLQSRLRIFALIAVVFFAIVLYAGLTGFMTLGAVLYNLISDVVGGVELIVLEETYLVPAPRTTPVRPAVHTPGNGGNDSTRPEPITTEPNAAITKTEPVATVEGS